MRSDLIKNIVQEHLSYRQAKKNENKIKQKPTMFECCCLTSGFWYSYWSFLSVHLWYNDSKYKLQNGMQSLLFLIDFKKLKLSH